jgi:phospholipid/cholesterol/gamma-HCH transport system substrate-binding protein
VLAVATTVLVVAGLFVGLRATHGVGKTMLTAYFETSNGIYPGDDVRILGVPVGKIDTIEPQPQRAKVTFWVDDKYKVPADAKAVVLSPSLVAARALELTPVYTDGPTLGDNAVIPQERTAVPVEWDELRDQLHKLSQTLQPTEPGGVSTLGAFVNTAANNLRGQGGAIRDTVMKLSGTLSALGDHSGDLFGALKNVSMLVSALHDSTDLMAQLNQNLAAVTALLANDPNEVGQAVTDLNTAINDVTGFIAENRDALGTTSDKAAQISQSIGESLDDIKQALHVVPTAFSNLVNVYAPAHASAVGVLQTDFISNPIQFICGGIQAASNLGAEQSAKLCAQYLAPIFKNRQYNFLIPLGFNLPVSAKARPNELTYSEDWMRPDYVPPTPPAAPPVDDPAAAPSPNEPPAAGPLPAEASLDQQSDPGVPATATDPGAGLPGLMVPAGAGS